MSESANPGGSNDPVGRDLDDGRPLVAGSSPDTVEGLRGALVEAEELIARLDADNERLRMKVLEVLEWMEEAVSAGVDHERRAEALEAELAAWRSTRIMRVLTPVRSLYARIRRLAPRRRGRGADDG